MTAPAVDGVAHGDRGRDRFVGGPGRPVVDHHDAATGEGAGEADPAGERGVDRLPHPSDEVDAAVAGAPPGLGRVEAGRHLRARLERPHPVGGSAAVGVRRAGRGQGHGRGDQQHRQQEGAEDGSAGSGAHDPTLQRAGRRDEALGGTWGRAADDGAWGRSRAPREAVVTIRGCPPISSKIAGGNPCMRVVLRTLDTAPARTTSAPTRAAGHRGRRPSVPTAPVGSGRAGRQGRGHPSSCDN